MADIGNDNEGIEAELVEGVEAPEAVAVEGKAPDPVEVEAPEVVVSIDGEELPRAEEDDAPQWAIDLRRQNMEAQRLNRELESKLAERAAPVAAPSPLGPKPTMEAHDWDAEAYDAALQNWYSQKAKADVEQAAAEQAKAAQDAKWQAKLAAYDKSKGALRVPDYDIAEHQVAMSLSDVQRAIIINASKNPALTFYAIGKRPGLAQSLSAITDLSEFAFAVGALEAKAKAVPRDAAPPPERVVKGGSGSVDNTAEKLLAEGMKSGDLSRYSEHMRLKRAA